MKNNTSNRIEAYKIKTFDEFLNKVDYSLINSLKADPQSTSDGTDNKPREVLSGHYVPVTPQALPSPKYVSHSKTFFNELGFSQQLAQEEDFIRLFSGDITSARDPMLPYGWATGYALSIYGTEYIQNCPFRTGNGYGDGRAISVFEGIFNGKRWEMQLKGGGPTPYCRGADGRAVLRSSIREFIAQDYMHALGVPTSRSLTLYVSEKESVIRPWYKENSSSLEPEILVETPAAISTRVAPSFLRIGQFELFARRVRNNSHKEALKELEMIVNHLIIRNYHDEINSNISFKDQVLSLANLYSERLTSLVADWIRVGYCQGNFNSDNCAAGGYTLDYGPFGFCELFNPSFQPWIGGGDHFSFLNQPIAAELNYSMFASSLEPLLKDSQDSIANLNFIRKDFKNLMGRKMEVMWAKKLGLKIFDKDLINNLFQLLNLSKVDYTIFFRKLSEIPESFITLKNSFYEPCSQEIEGLWISWFKSWRNLINKTGEVEQISKEMKLVNPKYTWREWLIAPAYEAAEKGDYRLVKELHNLFNDPYNEHSNEMQEKFDRLRPSKYSNCGGISHYSCSS